MYLILFVLHNTTNLQEILNAWNEAGVTGITILPSTGMCRLRKSQALREDLPLIPTLEDLLNSEEKLNRTIFSIVGSEALVDEVIKATEKIVGDLNRPNTGILAVLPTFKVHGLNRRDE